ncbi:MAG TPA: glucokinase [Gammaproteobacteria bacterium]|nr:glucokinase [Gammaproteobacteria bacterium]
MRTNTALIRERNFEPASVSTQADGKLVLVGDVGATNARFRLAPWPQAGAAVQWASDLLVLPTRGYTVGARLLADAYAQLAWPSLGACAIAAAGPVSAGGARLSVVNTELLFEQGAVAEQLGVRPTLYNDFYAQARAIPHLQQLLQVGGDATASGVRAILGAGSGLGMATLVPSAPRQWLVLPSEGGHANLAPGSFLEAELWSVLAQEHAHVSWETVLCGPGIVNLYRAMASIWGAQPAHERAEDVVAQGLASDPLCHQTLETFAGLLGAAAGNLALTVGARGGVYISGGIPPQLAEFLPSSPLRRRFEERGDLSAYAQAIPLYLVMDEQPGLLGALYSLSD